MPSPAPMSRSRNSRSTAISASETGEEVGPLVQVRSGAPNIACASAPASRTAASSRAEICAKPATSMAGNSQTLHAHGRRIGAVAEGQVVRRLEACEYIAERAGDRDLADRESALAVLDPESGGAAAIVAGHQIDPHADQVGDEKAVLDLGDQRVGALGSRRQMKVARARRRHHGGGALRMACGLQAELTRRSTVE